MVTWWPHWPSTQVSPGQNRNRWYISSTYIFQNCNVEVCQTLHECCGHNTIHSLKLKVFIQTFCQTYTQTIEVFDLDAQLAPHSSAFTCHDPSACVLEILDQCDRDGWLLKTSCYKWVNDIAIVQCIKRLAAGLRSGFFLKFMFHTSGSRAPHSRFCCPGYFFLLVSQSVILQSSTVEILKKRMHKVAPW